MFFSVKGVCFCTHAAPSHSRSRAAAPSPHKWWCRSLADMPGAEMFMILTFSAPHHTKELSELNSLFSQLHVHFYFSRGNKLLFPAPSSRSFEAQLVPQTSASGSPPPTPAACSAWPPAGWAPQQRLCFPLAAGAAAAEWTRWSRSHSPRWRWRLSAAAHPSCWAHVGVGAPADEMLIWKDCSLQIEISVISRIVLVALINEQVEATWSRACASCSSKASLRSCSRWFLCRRDWPIRAASSKSLSRCPNRSSESIVQSDYPIWQGINKWAEKLPRPGAAWPLPCHCRSWSSAPHGQHWGLAREKVFYFKTHIWKHNKSMQKLAFTKTKKNESQKIK